MTEAKKSKSQSQNELDKAQEQFDAFDKQIKDMTLGSLKNKLEIIK